MNNPTPLFNHQQLLNYLSLRYKTETKGASQILVGYLYLCFIVLCDQVSRVEGIFQKEMLTLNTHDSAIANLQDINRRLEITKIQMVGTLNELEEIGELNFNWASSMASLLSRL